MDKGIVMKAWKKTLFALLLVGTAVACAGCGCSSKTDNDKKPQQSGGQSDGGGFVPDESDFDFGNVSSSFDTPIDRFE